MYAIQVDLIKVFTPQPIQPPIQFRIFAAIQLFEIVNGAKNRHGANIGDC